MDVPAFFGLGSAAAAAPSTSHLVYSGAAAAVERAAQQAGRVRAGAFLDFCRRRSRPRWKEGPHHALLCQTLQDVVDAAAQNAGKGEDGEAGEGVRQMIFAPPRHGKSHTTSVMLPAYALGHYNEFAVILAMYGQKIASSKSRAARNLMAAVAPSEFGVRVDETSRAANDWHIVGGEGHQGRMIAAGVGGALTGEGGNLLLCDDPIKNSRDAHSVDIRESVWDWWRTVFMTRAEPGASVVLMLTRWHEDDLAGRLLKEQGRAEEGGAWRVLELPAESKGEERDVLRRPKGRALWPARFNEAKLKQTRREIGEYFYSAMYQQEPLPEGGAFFRRSQFRYARREVVGGRDVYVLVRRDAEGKVQEWRVNVSDTWCFISADTALSIKQKADYTAFLVWLVTKKLEGRRRRILVEVVREKLEAPDQLPRLIKLAASWDARFVAIEASTAGLAVIQQARRKKKFAVRECKADQDKQARAAPLQGAYEAEEVFHLAGQQWLSDYETELVGFPRAAHDDQVDAAAYSELILIEGKGTTSVKMGEASAKLARPSRWLSGLR